MGKSLSPAKMSDMEDDFMCDDEEDYDLVRLTEINATVNVLNALRVQQSGVGKLRFGCCCEIYFTAEVLSRWLVG